MLKQICLQWVHKRKNETSRLFSYHREFIEVFFDDNQSTLFTDFL